MRKIYKILPFFIVEFLIKKFGEKIYLNGKSAFIAYDNIYILDDE